MKSLLFVFLICANASAYHFDYTQCGELVRSKELITKISAVKKVLNRSGTPYSPSIAVIKTSRAKICRYKRIDRGNIAARVSIGFELEADLWSKDETFGRYSTECFVAFDYLKNRDWDAQTLNCNNYDLFKVVGEQL